MDFLRALRIRPFALLWAGQTVSRLGDSVYRIALSWWVLEKTGSAAAMAAVAVFTLVPMLLFLFVGGLIVDRLPRFRILIASDVVNTGVVGVIAVLAQTNRLEVWHIYAASVVFGLAEAFFYPAYTASVPQIVPVETLPSANALTGLTWQLSGIVGPSIGALLVAWGGTSVAFGLDSASFLVSAALLFPLRRIMPPAATEPRASAVADMRQGMATVLASPWLWVSILVFAFANVTDSGPRNVALPFLIHDHLGLDVQALGLVASALAAGSVVGAVGMGRLHRIRRRGITTYGGIAFGGLMVAGFGLARSLPVLGILSFAYGVAFSIASLIWTQSLQEMVPPEKMGRVSSIDAFGSFVLMPAGFAFAGWLTDAIGPAMVFVLGGTATIGLAFLALLHPGVRRLD
jgi:MFS family permease